MKSRHNPGTSRAEIVDKSGVAKGAPVGKTAVRLLDYRTAAAYMSLSYWTLRDLVLRGDVPHVRCGKRILIDRGDLDAWIERNKFEGV